MIKKITYNFIALVMLINLVGCTKDLEEYNKPAVYWYSKIIESVSDDNLDMADDYYTSLQGEHIGSPLLPEATVILAMAHLKEEDYLLSEYFFDEYVKRYANPNEKEFSHFMKIKAKYLALPNPRRDQALIHGAIDDCKRFQYSYPNSNYYHLVNTMKTNLLMAEASFNENIADLYERIDKPKGATFYKAKKPQPWIVWDEVAIAKSPWYSAWFEGNGKGSWYGFLIPDTQSVVSRNSVQEDENNETK